MADGGRSRLVDRAILVVEAAVGIGVVSAIVGRTYGFSSTLMFVMTGVATAFSGYVLVRMLSSLKDETLEVAGRVEDEQRAALEHEKLLLLQGIKELEADAAVGKVDAADYEHLRRTAEARALEIIHELKESDAKWMAEAEAFVTQKLGRTVGPETPEGEAPAPREDPAVYETQTREERARRMAFSGLFDDRPVAMSAQGDDRVTCGGCDTENETDARFCIGCGRPRRPESAEETATQLAEGAA